MLYFLFPKECLICFKTGAWLCDKCQKKLITTLPNCYICKKLSNGYMTHQSCRKTNSLQQVITLWKYNEYSKKLIHNFKYKNRVKVGEFIFSLFEEKLKNIESKGTLLVPLPSHKSKTLERGFNPTEILSVLIAQRMGLEINNRLIIKKKRNFAQASLKYEQRVENVKDIFKINLNESQILKKYNQILIVDDIITTGATLDEISCEILSNLEFKIEVKALCIFQGSFRKNEHQKSLQSGK